MPRRCRMDQTDSVHHVMARTVEGRPLFADDSDRAAFVSRLSDACSGSSTAVIAWALMDNHLHLLVRCGDRPLSQFMQIVLGGYARYFNDRHRRKGHLFQGRFKSILVNDSLYLLTAVRYIHLNPVAAGIVADLDELDVYPWTGHRALIGGCRIEGQDTNMVFRNLPALGSCSDPAEAYRALMRSSSSPVDYVGSAYLLGLDGLHSASWEDILARSDSQRTPVLGDLDRCRGNAREAGRELAGRVRDRSVSHQRVEAILDEITTKWGVSIDQLRGRSRKGPVTEARRQAAVRLVREAGFSMADAGRALGISKQSIGYLVEKALGWKQS